MMSAVSDNSNLNGGSEMGVGGDERIASNLISILLLVSDPFFPFWCPFLMHVRGVSVCYFTGLYLADHGVTVCSFTVFNLVERGVIVFSFTFSKLSD